MKLTVNLGKDSYPIYIENNLLKHANSLIGEIFSGRRIMIISDDNVYPLYGQKLTEQLSADYDLSHLVLPHGEGTKSFQTLPVIYAALLKARISRSDLIIALGGGVIGDLAGFAASSFLRGVKFVQIPTSLLAQVDSSVGGKVAVDLPEGKNLVGAFYQPKLVLIDPLVLDTLNPRFINDGMGEVIKYGCIKDSELFCTLEAHSSFTELKEELPSIIHRCVDIKRVVVEHDQFDTGERMLLNFGHTLGHTIEQYYHYERESHGEAVAIGMYQITRLSEDLGLTAGKTSLRIRKLLEAYGLPYECGLPIQELLHAIAVDKKNLNNRLNVILLHDIGSSYIHPTTSAFFSRESNYII
ncbi:MAG: 3-dehydroquinate synthase [Dorea sp.]|uniref:3-dehydroquinate synthase n=1 Tax=Sporofaciens musculi TaxID=2681861 RepID=UPI002171D981|nr:3-dehydroquinate synthase [Sporofaciens musculi]MCI9421288.1 3-dehydroquinate synthase [Dorea sp.]